jgi:hypothetical protein
MMDMKQLTQLGTYIGKGNTQRAVDYLAELGKKDRQAKDLYGNVRGLGTREQDDALRKYLSDFPAYSAGNLGKRDEKESVSHVSLDYIKPIGRPTNPDPLVMLYQLKKQYESGRLSSDEAYTRLESLRGQFREYEDKFFELYGDLELACSSKIEENLRTANKTNLS